MRKVILTLTTAGLMLAFPFVATAQEEEPPPPPTEVTCYPLLSAFVCYLPVNVGPFIFNVDVDAPIESVFPRPPEE